MRGNNLTWMLLLTFVTGVVDAVSFLGLGQVFAAMQTGNVIFLGLGLGGGNSVTVLAPLIGLGSFLLGGAVAAWRGSSKSLEAEQLLASALLLELGLLLAATLVAIAVDVSPGDTTAYLLIGLLSLAMGLRNTVVRGVGNPNLATTVLNLTLVASSRADLAERGVAFLAILLGAVVGAVALQATLTLALAIAAATAALAAAIQHQAPAAARAAS